jgi:hypothetical protein
VLLIAGFLRLKGIAWGLRHVPMEAERDFVESVWKMVGAHDLDQRFYEYPGLFFLLLYPGVAAVKAIGLSEAAAYAASRIIVACFGVFSVALTFALGSRMLGRRAALWAALLLAVSPLEVATAHRVRPDVALETFGLLAFLAYRSLGPRLAGDLKSAALMGLATAVKPTGVFLFPSYLAARRLAGGRLWPRAALVAALSGLVVVAATPSLFIAPARFLGGLENQWTYHYRQEHWQGGAPALPIKPSVASDYVPTEGTPSRFGLLLYYLRVMEQHLGWAASVFAGVALVGLGRAWRAWLPLLILPCVSLGVYSTAEVGKARFVVPFAGILCLLAASGLRRVWSWKPALGLAAGALAILPPALDSLSYANGISKPTPLDQAVDWIDAHLSAGALVLTTDRHIGLDESRFAVNSPPREPTLDRLAARSADIVVAEPSDPLVRGLREEYHAAAAIPEAGPSLGLFVAPTAERESLRPLSPAAVKLIAASEDRRWIEIVFGRSVRLARIELRPRRAIASDLALRVTEDGRAWREVPTGELRSRVGALRQILLLAPTPCVGLRVGPRRERSRWLADVVQVSEADQP